MRSVKAQWGEIGRNATNRIGLLPSWNCGGTALADEFPQPLNRWAVQSVDRNNRLQSAIQALRRGIGTRPIEFVEDLGGRVGAVFPVQRDVPVLKQDL